ncbi:MAG: hypothetical protein J6N52_12855 [Clostridia bacterium]|nr:hypothetical protein [Clostridia bacterium]
MKKYAKPEFNFYKFEVETSIMTESPTPSPTGMVVFGGSQLSAASVDQLPQTDALTKAYTEYGDGGDWNWENK